MSDEEESQKGFRVRDRRRFTAEGETRAEAEDEPTSTANTAAPQEPAAPSGAPPEMDFISFAASLATNALAAMGALPPEQSRGLPPPNPELAREYINILSMLQQKTRGNLTGQEDAMLAQMLAELRMRFVEATKPAKSGQ